MPRKVQIIPQFELYEIFYDSVYHRENSPNKNTIDMETPIFFSLEDMEDSDSHTLKAELLVAHSISHPFSCQVEKSKCTKVQNPMDFGVS